MKIQDGVQLIRQDKQDYMLMKVDNMSRTLDNSIISMNIKERELKEFIGILSDFLMCRKTTMHDNIDWPVIIKLSKIHQVEGIVYFQCRGLIPSEIHTTVEQAYAAAIYYFKNRENILQGIRKSFEQNGIQSFEVKGTKVAKYYPIPALKTMGDLDIVIHKKQMALAGELLIEKGFIKLFDFINKESGYSYNKINVELHYQLIYDEIVTDKKQQEFFNNCWEYVNNGELDHSFHFLFLIAHLRKHMLNEGAGFRQFMDIAAVVKNDASLNWNWIAEKLDYLKLSRFAETCLGLIDYWFGIKAPIQYPRAEQTFLDCASMRIASNGVFGFSNKDNFNNDVYNHIINFKGPRWAGRMLIAMKRAFPGYAFLRVGEPYKFLNGRPWLLPLAWCRRFYLMARGKTTDASDIMGKIMASDEAVDLRLEELRHWGLAE